MESSFLAGAAVRFPHLSGPGSCLGVLYLPLMVFHSLKPLAAAQVLLSTPGLPPSCNTCQDLLNFLIRLLWSFLDT